jgi:hypothetical protein
MTKLFIAPQFIGGATMGAPPPSGAGAMLGRTSAPSVARSLPPSGGVGHGSHELDCHEYSVTTERGCFSTV